MIWSCRHRMSLKYGAWYVVDDIDTMYASHKAWLEIVVKGMTKEKKRENQSAASSTGEAAGCNASPDSMAKQPKLKKHRVA
mmetsp:Transcript_88718/g.266897  ORF Transcript_88718/g.266897 Transcript_88718/m.266897 type:complete len:81 (-) Transcript_88718:18-260(-)